MRWCSPGGELDVAKIGSEEIPMLLHRRIVGRTHIRFVHVFYDLVGILGFPKLLERRVGMERGPVLFPYLPVGMSHKIDECVSKSRIIVGYPITDDIEIVLGL